MTLKELLNQIESTAGKTLPTAACLRAGCQVAAIQQIEEKGTLIVYQNGFALYEVEGACTVLRADHCGDYVYFGRDKQTAISSEDFSEMDWWVRLLIEGEDRLIHNQNARMERHEYPLESCCAELQTYSDGFQEQLEVREALVAAFDILTKRQREVVQHYYIEGLEEKEIARIYGISQQAVSLTLSDARKKLHKRKKNIF